MAARVYSTQLWMENSISGGPNPIYGVPPGKRTVIRTMTMTFGTNVSSGGGFVTHRPSGCVVWSFASGPVTFLHTEVFNGHIVLGAGESIDLSTFGAWVGDFSGSGYELTLP